MPYTTYKSKHKPKERTTMKIFKSKAYKLFIYSIYISFALLVLVIFLAGGGDKSQAATESERTLESIAIERSANLVNSHSPYTCNIYDKSESFVRTLEDVRVVCDTTKYFDVKIKNGKVFVKKAY